MGMGERGIKFTISAFDKFSKPLDDFSRKMDASTAGLRRLGASMSGLSRASGLAGVSQGFGNVAAAGTALASRLALIGGAVGYGFKKGFVDVASQFEKFETILNTLNMGDTAKSKRELGWISDFAAKTPYELAEVTDAFVQLRSYGMEPMNGLLQTLGDTSSAMGKPLKQAVEAIADAVTGENERLKEFGIVGRKVGDKIVYEYTNAAGQQAKMMAKANDRAAIQATLTKIWAEKYGGGMEALSKTFGGMMSNLSDAWSRFARKVMDNGAFDWMKEKLSGILSTIDQMSSDGRLDAWAQQWGEKITQFLQRAWDLGLGFATGLMAIGSALAWTADLLGSWERLGIAIAALMGVKLVVAIGSLLGSLLTLGAAALPVLASLATGFISLGVAIMTTPIGWFLGGLALVTAGIVLVWKKWETITAWFREKTPKWLLRLFGAESGGGASPGVGNAMPALPEVGGWERNAKGLFSSPQGWEGAAARPSLGAAGLQRSLAESRSTSLERQESKVTVEVLAPRGTQIRQSGAPVDLDVNWAMGPAMAD